MGSGHIVAHRGTGRLTGAVVLVAWSLGGSVVVGSWVGGCLGSWVALGGLLWVGGSLGGVGSGRLSGVLWVWWQSVGNLVWVGWVLSGNGSKWGGSGWGLGRGQSGLVKPLLTRTGTSPRTRTTRTGLRGT